MRVLEGPGGVVTKAPPPNLTPGDLTWPFRPRQRSFTEKTRSGHLTRPGRDLTWHNLARHCSESTKTVSQARIRGLETGAAGHFGCELLDGQNAASQQVGQQLGLGIHGGGAVPAIMSDDAK